MSGEVSNNPCCMAKESGDWCHDVDTKLLLVHGGKTYCIFHAPAECQEKLNQWEDDLVYARINKAKKDDTPCDLRGTVFPQEISFSQYDKEHPLPAMDLCYATFTGHANFLGATFSGDADFGVACFAGDARFNDATFTASANFAGTPFNGGADFMCATFTGIANFEGAAFLRDTYFNRSKFTGNANFEGATFSVDTVSGDTDFSGATFSGDADFGVACFAGDARFNDATFTASANFGGATFNGGADFAGVPFNGGVDFVGATFTSDADFSGATLCKPIVFQNSGIFPNVLFNQTKFDERVVFRQITFKNGTFDCCLAARSVIFDDCDLSGLSLVGAPIEDFRFISCKWPRSKGRNVIYDSRLTKYHEKEDQPVKVTGFFPLGNQDQEEILEKPLPDNEYIEDLFRRLKAVAQKEHDDLAASDWHYGEKEMQLRRLQEESSLKNFRWDWGWFGSLFLYIVTWIYKRISGYGEEPLRAFAVLMILGLLPTPLLSYLLPGLPSPFPGGVEHYLPLMKKIPDGNAWYVSFWMVLWQLLVTIQAALLGFALRNKLRR